jgi:enamine deaminase RidA (YjgF/YER057c/UK114 family)
MKKFLLLLTIFQVFFLLSICAQEKSIQKQKFNWGRGEQDTATGYAQAVKVDNVIYISGTVAREVTPESIKRVYEALEKTLQYYGATFQNVVKENLYTTDIEAMKQHNAARKAFYKGDFPAATWVQISRLYMADAKLEIELIAHLPK